MSDDTKKKSGIFKWVLLAIVLLVAIVVALPFLIDANQFRPQVQSRLSAALGREVKIGNLKLSLLSGSVAVDDIAIADNPGFSRSPFVTARSLKIGVEMKPLIFSKVVRITRIYLENPSITLIRSDSGKWNFSDLASNAGASKNQTGAGQSGNVTSADVSIKELKITDGTVTIVQGRRKPSIYKQVNINASNLSLDSSFPFLLSASLPGGGTLHLEGNAGSLSKTDMIMTPLSAQIAVKQLNLVASGYVPPGTGLAGIIDFDGALSSNGRLVESKGKASADKLQLAKGGSPAGRPLSLEYVVNYDLQKQQGSLNQAEVAFGKAAAHLNGLFDTQGDSLALNVKVRGEDMPLQDLEALLPAFGIALPKGASLQGGVLNADLSAEGPLENLVTAGTAEISKTRLTGFDLGGKMSSIASLAGIKSSSETQIEKLATAMRLSKEGIQVGNLQLIVPALGELTGQGKVGSDQSLDFKMMAMLKPSGGIGASLARLTQTSSLHVPFFVRGTASDPKFVPDVKNTAGSLLNGVTGKQGSNEGASDAGKMLGDTLRGFFNKKKK
jgi:AsmA protein